MRGSSAYSFDATKDNQAENPLPPFDETDDVPDIPVPIASEYPEPDTKFEQVSIPLSDLNRRASSTEASSSHTQSAELLQDTRDRDLDTVPLTPVVIELQPRKKSITTNV